MCVVNTEMQTTAITAILSSVWRPLCRGGGASIRSTKKDTIDQKWLQRLSITGSNRSVHAENPPPLPPCHIDIVISFIGIFYRKINQQKISTASTVCSFDVSKLPFLFACAAVTVCSAPSVVSTSSYIKQCFRGKYTINNVILATSYVN